MFSFTSFLLKNRLDQLPTEPWWYHCIRVFSSPASYILPLHPALLRLGADGPSALHCTCWQQDVGDEILTRTAFHGRPFSEFLLLIFSFLPGLWTPEMSPGSEYTASSHLVDAGWEQLRFLFRNTDTLQGKIQQLFASPGSRGKGALFCWNNLGSDGRFC